MKFAEKLLQPVYGYIELGLFAEAAEELENFPAEVKHHPLMLLGKMDLLIETRRWEEGVIAGQECCRLLPDESEFWIKRAYCLHELKRTQDAKTVLLSAPKSLRTQAVYFYNMACYEAQLGNLDSAKAFLKSCFARDKSYKQASLIDADLQPLWVAMDKEGNTCER